MEMRLPSEPISRQHTPTLSSPPEPRFQRFIRQMKDAGPKMILDQLKENLQEATNDAVDEEVTFLSILYCK